MASVKSQQSQTVEVHCTHGNPWHGCDTSATPPLNGTLASYDAALGDDTRLRVNMIDFAHVSTATHGRIDEGYLLGLRTLLGIMNGTL